MALFNIEKLNNNLFYHIINVKKKIALSCKIQKSNFINWIFIYDKNTQNIKNKREFPSSGTGNPEKNIYC